MGYSLYRLEIIKERFVNSNAKDLENLFLFIEDQLGKPDNPESKYIVFLDEKLVGRIKANISEIKSTDLDIILDFVEERIGICRSSDMADRITGHLKHDQYYFREQEYTEIENYIIKLLIG